MKTNRTNSGGGEVDLLVIGTGAAGMAAAIRGAELGRRVAIVEEGTVGGTCVNVGCIPSKNLLAVADRYHGAREGLPGIGACEPSVDWPGVRARKRELVESLRRSKYLDVVDSYPEITLLRGRARLTGGGGVDVAGVSHLPSKVVVATGTTPRRPEVPGLETVDLLDSASAMELDALPQSMIVLGGGSVGLELGQMFSRLGTRVTIVELLPRLLPGDHEDASEEIRRSLEREGLTILTGARPTEMERAEDGVRVRVETGAEVRWLEAERLLAAVGRTANVRGLGLEDAGVELDRLGSIRIDAGMRTSNPDVFAAGDVTGGPGFVYVAAAGGRIAADNAVGEGKRELDLRAVPRVTFTSPQVAGVGFTPAQARERGLDVRVSRLGLEHLPRALVEGRVEGWIELVADESGRLIGAHAVAPIAAELLGEATLAVRLGLSVEDLTDTFHPYLTWVEGLKLAAQGFETDVSKLSCCA